MLEDLLHEAGRADEVEQVHVLTALRGTPVTELVSQFYQTLSNPTLGSKPCSY